MDDCREEVRRCWWHFELVNSAFQPVQIELNGKHADLAAYSVLLRADKLIVSVAAQQDSPQNTAVQLSGFLSQGETGIDHMTGSMDPSRSVTSPGQTCFVAVVVATCDRPELLGSVCLPSVAKQTRAPDLVVVVDDSKVRLVSGSTRTCSSADHVSAGYRDMQCRKRMQLHASLLWHTTL